MDLSSFFAASVIFAIPGIIARRVYQLLTTPQKDRLQWEEMAQVILFSAGSYLGIAALGTIIPQLNVDFLFEPEPSLSAINSVSVWFSIITAALVGYILAHVQAKIRNERWINRLAIKLKVTKRFDDRSVWLQFLDLGEYDYIMVNDLKENLLYYGLLRSYTDLGNLREVLLADVTVFSAQSGENLYESDTIYLARDPSELSLELPKEVREVRNAKISQETNEH